MWRHLGQGLVVFALGWALTAGSLAWLHAATQPSRATELAVLVLANLTATVLRFTLLRHWVFARTAPPAVVPGPAAVPVGGSR